MYYLFIYIIYICIIYIFLFFLYIICIICVLFICVLFICFLFICIIYLFIYFWIGKAIRHIDTLVAKGGKLNRYIAESFGGGPKLQKDILYDFFCKGFDGSGADNFFDAGSCIDGRLTSAWNWCSQLEKKPFFPDL